MRTTVSVDWVQAQAAVARAGPRVSALLRSVRNPTAPALGKWNLTDVAVHLSHAVDAVAAVAQGGGGLLDDVWALSGMSDMLVTAESERDLRALADRIDASVAAFLGLMKGATADTAKTWLVQGIEVPLSMVTCHVLNELVMHGRDIALADGQPWPIDRDTAALVLAGFVLPSLGALGRSMTTDAAKGKRISYDVRLRGGGPDRRFQFRFDDGDFSITPGPPAGPVDTHLIVDPETFLLVAWNRVGQWGGIAKGQLFAYGRKPWLGLQLRKLLKNP